MRNWDEQSELRWSSPLNDNAKASSWSTALATLAFEQIGEHVEKFHQDFRVIENFQDLKSLIG